MKSIKSLLFRNLAIVIAIIFIASSINEWFQYKSLLKYFEKQQIQASHVLASNLEGTILFESKEDFNNLVKYTKAKSILVIDSKGQLLFSKGEIFNHNNYNDSATWSDEYITIRTEVASDSIIIGTLYLRLSTNEISLLTRQNFIYLFCSFSLLLFVFILFSNILNKKIVIPINSLNSLIKKVISQNDISIRVPSKVDTLEINELSTSFNTLMDNLEHHNEKLRDLNINLEHKVDVKTKKLKQAIEDLRKYQDQVIAQEKLASLGSLAAGIAHEIKNPINLINNSAVIIDSFVKEELLPKKEDFINNNFSKETALEFFSDLEDIASASLIVSNNGKRADAIIKSMLLLSRSQKAQEEEASISYHLSNALNLSFHAMRAKKSSIDVEILQDINDTPITKCFPQDIERAFVNIIDNSFYSMKEKKAELKDSYSPILKIEATTLKNDIIITIKDNGRGVEDKVLKKILEPFFTTKPAGEGTGLGMSMVNDIIIAHKGSLQMTSKVGHWTQTKIIIPLNSD